MIYDVGLMIDCDEAEKKNEKTFKQNVASGYDQGMWQLGVVIGCGHWVGH